MMRFSSTIKKLCCNQNMTQEEIEDILSILPQAVNRWKIDATMPNIPILLVFCNFFGGNIGFSVGN